MNKFLFILLFVSVSFFTFVTTKSASAAVSPTSLLVRPFGGAVYGVRPCICNAGFMVTIQDYTTMMPINLMVIPFVSRINLNYAFLPGNGVLGSFYPTPMQCLVFPPFCTSIGTAIGVVVSMPLAGVGTSLLPSKVLPI